MGATLAAGSAFVFFVVAFVALAIGGFDRAAAAAALFGLMFLAVSVALLAGSRR